MPLRTRPPNLSITSFFLIWGLAQTVPATGKDIEAPRITKEQLLSMMGNPDVVILDVRESESYKDSQWKIKGAVREDPTKDVKTWAGKYPKESTLVFYCS